MVIREVAWFYHSLLEYDWFVALCKGTVCLYLRYVRLA